MIRIIAIDWSGAKVRAERKIWIAEASDGRLITLENGRDRDATARWLIEQHRRSERLIVGMDFAFSFPVWFLDQLGIAHAPELWRRLHDGHHAEWLAACPSPFWGRPGSKCSLPDIARRFRRTDGDHAAKSVFQIGGAGAVGTASIRGMVTLHALRDAGFAVWPFDEPRPGQSVVLEIYPRAWTRGVTKSNPAHRASFLDSHGERIPRALRSLACASDDAFDAGVSALAMDAGRTTLEGLPAIEDSTLRREGLIWTAT